MASIRSLRKLRTVGGGTDAERVAWLREVTARAGHTNVFNVTLARTGDRLHVAWRALPAGGERPFHAFCTAVDVDGGNPGEVVDLTAHAAAHGVPVVADPKLFVAHGKVYVTFNTGFVAAPERNDVYVMRVAPHLRAPQRCVLDQRRRIEKNWVFFPHPAGGLGAVHRIGPLVQLVQTDGGLGKDGPLGFSRLPGVERPSAALGLTLGTPLYRDGDRYYGIVHEKRKYRRRALYLGRPAVFEGLGTSDARVRVSDLRLVHSWRAMLPHRARFNPSLLSATYFSGITKLDGGLVLGYGINDKDFGITKVDRSLWS
ncbi:hypothetical protein KIN34_05375 [Cellulomonas sp. DKR-3]|uniref:DUF2804 domain-containing protein n=1 Tax=Cellulomonas fulva TaxID=2835530 RepID=A0ABS5TX80_9CELL|nr:hypothetical protein [Cellulomonas fulva]MBT0993714.1 hypothetical protein [Cellulomonas fulva]